MEPEKQPELAPLDIVVSDQTLEEIRSNLSTSYGLEESNKEDWHARAGKKGAYRIQELLHKGKLYEEHFNLKPGRQRIRQLIQMGKKYEKELEPKKPVKEKRFRVKKGQRKDLVMAFLMALEKMVKPSFRKDIERLISELSKEDNHGGSENKRTDNTNNLQDQV